jgi:hypothetical protein
MAANGEKRHPLPMDVPNGHRGKNLQAKRRRRRGPNLSAAQPEQLLTLEYFKGKSIAPGANSWARRLA